MPKSRGNSAVKAMFVYSYCSVCGKRYIAAKHTVYKLMFRGKTKHFCGYTCYRKIDKLMEEKNTEELVKFFNPDNN